MAKDKGLIYTAEKIKVKQLLLWGLQSAVLAVGLKLYFLSF